MAKVLVVTTSMGTKWESYSQILIKEKVPEWDRIIVDGRKNWTPTGFISNIINQDVDYIFHIDEDCFVGSRDQLLELINIFENDHKLVAAGVPDGGHYYRDHNPAALNLFFVLFRMDALKEAWSKKNYWTQLKFQEKYSENVKRQRTNLDASRINWDEGEPYYPLFWSLLEAGGNFLYLGDELHRSRWSTRVLSPSGEPIAEHLWYLRQWFSHAVMPGHDCSNVSRYKSFEHDLLSRPQSGINFRANLAFIQGKRLLRKVFS